MTCNLINDIEQKNQMFLLKPSNDCFQNLFYIHDHFLKIPAVYIWTMWGKLQFLIVKWNLRIFMFKGVFT